MLYFEKNFFPITNELFVFIILQKNLFNKSIKFIKIFAYIKYPFNFIFYRKES